jgi:hypothetical protein
VLKLTRKRAHALAVTAVLVAVGIALAVTLPSGRSVTISGRVTCKSGEPVVGVWIDAANGGSGFASMYAEPTNRSRARYVRNLPFGGSYALHVGCGGSPQRWAIANYSPYVSLPQTDFVCFDESTGTNFGKCQQQ